MSPDHDSTCLLPKGEVSQGSGNVATPHIFADKIDMEKYIIIIALYYSSN